MDKAAQIQRTFIPGDKWLYYKIYTGAMMSETVLKNTIKPLAEEFTKTQLINKWFFVRYSDPQPHLRVRFHCVNTRSINTLIRKLNKFIKPYIENNHIWNIQIDTYQREIERYGETLIQLVEDIFCNDSFMVVNVLNMLDGDDGEIVRWRFALLSVDGLLNDFKLNDEEKYNLLQKLSEAYGKEFGINRLLKRQIDSKYRDETKEIIKIISGQEKYFDHEVYRILHQRSERNRHLITSIFEQNDSYQSSDHLLTSIIHMSMNRIFIAKQRMHELMIYDFLFRYYKSVLARQSLSI